MKPYDKEFVDSAANALHLTFLDMDVHKENFPHSSPWRFNFTKDVGDVILYMLTTVSSTPETMEEVIAEFPWYQELLSIYPDLIGDSRKMEADILNFRNPMPPFPALLVKFVRMKNETANPKLKQRYGGLAEQVILFLREFTKAFYTAADRRTVVRLEHWFAGLESYIRE